MYITDPGLPDDSDLRSRVSLRLGRLSKMCDDPCASTCASTCAPEDPEVFTPVSSISINSSQLLFSPPHRTDDSWCEQRSFSSQLPSQRSSMARSMSAPSLNVTRESPLRSFQTPPRANDVRVTSPPHIGLLQPHVLDPSGSFSAELKCRSAAKWLQKGRNSAVPKLGAVDPYVECMRLQAVDLRKRADHLRWNRIVTEQAQNIGEALQAVAHGADVAHLEAAVAKAERSEIGHGHEIVREGKQQILSWRQRRRIEDIARLEDELGWKLQNSIETGNLRILARDIDEASRALGSSHRTVQNARDALKEQRRDQQRSLWSGLVQEHESLMLDACATENIGQIARRVLATSTSKLGVGHPIVKHGKDCIRCLKQRAHRAQQETFQRECLSMLSAPFISDALAASELGQCQSFW